MIGKILNYGVFDSRKTYKTEKFSPSRKVQAFEFDFILSCDLGATSFIDDKSLKLTPNTLIIRKPDQKSHSKLHFKCYCLHLEVEKTSKIYQDLCSAPNYFTFINDKTYRSIFESIFQHLTKVNEGEDDYFVCSKILELIYHIKKDECYNQNIRHHSAKKEHTSIQKAIAFIKKNYENNIQLKDLGKLSGYSPNHFQRLFTEITGVSPAKYLEEVRINRAKFLLVENEKSISEIAYECGFSSQSYFSKAFKKHTLLSPHEFKTSATFKYQDE